MKKFVFALLSFISLSVFAEVSTQCRWTSQSECKGKSIGSSCKSNGQCLVKEWAFSEAECNCFEKMDEKKSFCNWSSDSECRKALAGAVLRDGICKIDRISFDEPVCKFSKKEQK